MALLDVSAASLVTMYVAFVALLLTGIAAGIMGSWWVTGWFWAALVVLAGITAAMIPLGVKPFSDIRRFAGVKYAINGKWFPPEPADPAKMNAAVAGLRPGLLSGIALAGLAIVLWLMMFKPF
ncbi:MAG: hypothetical protein WEB63_11905 [Cucumibacter sp.]